MAYGIGAAATRLAKLVKGGADEGRNTRLALVLRLENVVQLRASIGQARMDQMLDRLTLRLVSEARLLPQTRGAGATEILGVFANPQALTPAQLIQQLQAICRTGIDLPELRIVPVINAVIVAGTAHRHELAALYATARLAMQNLDPLTESGHVLYLDMPQDGGVFGASPEPLLSAQDVELRFQPQICCDTGQVSALRAVIRIARPDTEAVDIADVQSRLEEDTLVSLTHAGLRLALSALRGWDRLGIWVPFVSLSLPGAVLADPIIADTIAWELDRFDLDPARLELEVIEPIGQSGGRLPVGESLQRLTGLGCRIALGEFGTGSAGLADMRRFGIGRVRIGREFTAGCDRRGDQQRMILAIIALAEHLNVATLADGVDTQAECAFLTQIGFNAVQGAAVAPWMDTEDADSFLMEHVHAMAAIPAMRSGA
ncbi:EAL domain-containing protein [Paracoccus mangrovi]|uniref:EAL domain-containing protein n=1 Tax=Paracoccus mangrovi TaxID=1715645 RepID=A0ABV7QZF1_9RHOB